MEWWHYVLIALASLGILKVHGYSRYLDGKRDGLQEALHILRKDK